VSVERDLEIQWLRTFKSVAQTGSMTKSSSLLNRSQSAISMHIKNLESVLEGELFHREIRRLTLTTLGQEFLIHADNILKAHRSAIVMAKEQDLTGKISLGIPDDYAVSFFPAILRAINEAYPQIEISFVCEPSSTLVPRIEKGEIDIGIITQDRTDRGVKIATVPLVWAGYIPYQWDETKPLPVAMYEFGSEARKKITGVLDQLKGGYKIIYSSAYIAGQIAAAQSGTALSMLTKCSVPERLPLVNHKALPTLPALEIAVFKSPAEDKRSALVDLIEELIIKTPFNGDYSFNAQT